MISIIGAGPVGCFTAYLLSKKFNVQIFEEHNKIGIPVQCTGITTASLANIIELNKKFIINKINTARIFSKNNLIELKLNNPNIIIDRYKFDNYLANKAEKRGVEIFLNHKFVGLKRKSILVKDKNKIKKIPTEYIIGADGPLSKVSKHINKNLKRNFMVGLQARVKLRNENIIEFYPYIGNFSWIVPENKETVRIGLASYKNTKTLFDKFLKLKNIKKKNIIEFQAGLIPIYNPKIKTQKNTMYIIGDAASQVKATTGGGILQGLTAAKILASSIINKKNYDRAWKKKIGKDLWLHLKLHNLLRKFNERDWDYLTNILNKQKNKKILEEYDRDYVSRFFLKLIIKEPRFLFFIKKLF